MSLRILETQTVARRRLPHVAECSIIFPRLPGLSAKGRITVNWIQWARQTASRSAGHCFISVHLRDSIMNLVESLERQREPNPNIPELNPGDTVKVHLRIVEGDRERVQVFRGTIIRMRGSRTNASFTVRRIASHGIGVERTFLLHSPRIEKVEVVRKARVRRAQLHYLRDRRGKHARLREKRTR